MSTHDVAYIAVRENDSAPTTPTNARSSQLIRQSHSIRFWGIFFGLCVLAFIAALDASVITTALPTITNQIGGARQYLWTANSFVVATTVTQPFYVQLPNAFGRRIPLVASIVAFMLGSGLAGGANGVGMHIAGRTIQGVGAGGIYVLLDIICCDSVPQRKRGKYLALMNSWSALAAGLAPVVGGALAEADRRWIFYMNLPICLVALIAIFSFMRVNTGDTSKEKRCYPLRTNRGRHCPPMVFLPLTLGSVGWAAFHVQQAFTSTPSVPARLFANRTSAICYIVVFLSSILVQQIAYFLPVYFQAGLGVTILQSGVNFLPFAIGALSFAVIGGILLEKLGVYKSIHIGAFALSAVGFGVFTLLDADTSRAEWAIFQLISSAGSGPLISTLLPGIMVALPESDAAISIAAYGFIRTVGMVWGVAIPCVIFNSEVNGRLDSISSSTIRAGLRDGAAYSFASEAYRLKQSLSPKEWNQFADLYTNSLKTIWWVGLGISLLGMALVFGERSLTLKTELVTGYGIDESRTEKDKQETGEIEVEKARKESL